MTLMSSSVTAAPSLGKRTITAMPVVPSLAALLKMTAKIVMTVKMMEIQVVLTLKKTMAMTTKMMVTMMMTRRKKQKRDIRAFSIYFFLL